MAKTPAKWDVEDPKFWESEGKAVANRNLWISIPNLLCGFAVWLYWGMVAKFIQKVHFSNPDLFNFTFGNDGQAYSGDAYRNLLFTLPAVAGLAGATLRIPNSFMIAICGGRNVKFMTTVMLMLPAIGAGIALQDPGVSFFVLIVLALISGVGGGAFASSMSNISFFFPKKVQGLALGLNAGLGNLGVSVMQFLLPWIITFGAFGSFGGEGYTVLEKGVESTRWIQNAGLVWLPILAFFAVAAFFGMNNLPQHKCGPTPVAIAKYLWLTLLGFAGASVAVGLLIMDWGPVPMLLKILVIVVIAVAVTLLMMRFLTPKDTKDKLVDQFAIFGNKHNWVMTWLYTMTFGSFIGYANAFPKLIDDVFGVIRVGADGSPLAEAIANPAAPLSSKYIWLGAGVGALIRPVGGWLSDKLGGARVTQWDTIVMIGATIGAGYFVSQAAASPTPEQYFMPFLLLFILLFATTGIGNGSTFRMIPIIFSKEQAGPVLGWTSAIAAYGAFLIPKIFGDQIAKGTPEYALYGFAGYYLSCLVVNWWFYARKNAEVPC
ncbi:MAG: NarK/NasA family nitrate transporter [Planctomycetes bacterium]|nr:NarK/NasA family nitrate transporter [Planctomycetota bacterium]MCB9904530.1 NarK/NasA family nitrate transporter [Planctomycetota bacterium]